MMWTGRRFGGGLGLSESFANFSPPKVVTITVKKEICSAPFELGSYNMIGNLSGLRNLPSARSARNFTKFSVEGAQNQRNSLRYSKL